ncbi:MAG: hypothetical protein Q9170_006099 [Blastenia crenularia]
MASTSTTNVSSQDGFEHQSSPSPTFKLLNILPANAHIQGSSPEGRLVQCELTLEPLLDAPDYEALSYTWGSTTQDRPVQIHFKSPELLDSSVSSTETVYVTKHLQAALLRLQQPTTPRRVWIDQLCINQKSIPERNAQVKLMADIYRRAKRTIVWLGEANILDEDREAIIGATQRMNFRPVEREWSEAKDQDILKDLVGFKAHGQAYELGQRRRQLLAELLNREWFTRAWVFQEVVIAKSGVIRCGSLEMDMDIFINLLDGVCELDLQEVDRAKSIMRSSKGYKPMFAIREARFESRNGLYFDTKSRWLATLWQAMGNLNATNQRDKVYAFLAFSDSEGEAQISPAYESSVASVYTDAAIRSIRSVHSLNVLELALKTKKSLPDLPSWVPDFSRPLSSLPLMTHNAGGGYFTASRKIPYPLPRIPSNSSMLEVRGHIIATIGPICPANHHTFDPSQTLHENIGLEEVTTWASTQSTSSKHPTPPDLPTKILRTLLAEGAAADDTSNNMNYEPDEILAVYQNESTILQAIDSKLVPSPSKRSDDPAMRKLKIQYRFYKWIKVISEILRNKKLFLTEGYLDMGLAYEAVEEGDLVCIFLGSKTPTVVRKVQTLDGAEERYRFIAQCYLDGWMSGEEHEGREWTEEGAETFILV